MKTTLQTSNYLQKSIPQVILLGILLSSPSPYVWAQHNPLFGSGNSYVNISKKTNGGFVQNGDTLEIRSNYFFGSSYNSANFGTNGNRYRIWAVRYYDSVPTFTQMLNGAADSLRLITNEGLTFRKYTLSANDDAATFNSNPGTGKYQVRINIGSNPSKPAAGNEGLVTDTTGASDAIIGTYKPKLFGGLLITTAFRVVVTGKAGDTITLGAGKLLFRKTSGGKDTVVNLTPYRIIIHSAVSSTLCSNSLGNNLASEFGGTFDSGLLHNRSSGPVFAIPSYDYKPLYITANTSDGSYAIVKNTSPSQSTNINARMQPSCALPTPIPTTDSCSKRMHGGFWEIMGDHTGTNNAAGNPPPGNGIKGGYMLMVNADVVTSEAYRQLVTGLCPDTYYEFSAWVKNICKRCGIDSNNIQNFKGGVKPSLAFSINGVDHYSSGELDSTGWIKKGFIFKTGPAETSATISIRNNASGGGGNDWVMDDISIGTCGPTSVMNYKPFLLGCKIATGTLVELADTVRYAYNPNYAWYRWERSTDGGLTWSTAPLTPNTGSVTPTLTNGSYQFIINYPPFLAYAADSGHMYRVKLATSFANLSTSNCSYTDGTNVYLKLITCSGVLNNAVITLTGKLLSNKTAELTYNIENGNLLNHCFIEKSTDGTAFKTIYHLKPVTTNQPMQYSFIDTFPGNGNFYYRIRTTDNKGLITYSKTIMVSNDVRFEAKSMLNQSDHSIISNISLPEDGDIYLQLVDIFGNRILNAEKHLYKGLNQLITGKINGARPGLYLLGIRYHNKVIQNKIIKFN